MKEDRHSVKAAQSFIVRLKTLESSSQCSHEGLVGTKAVGPDYEVLGRPSVSLDDIRNFRQHRSRAPGHREYRWTSGVETTTGPLGQGVAASVGMGIAGKWLAARYNRPGFDIFDYTIYSMCGDSCMMEGVSS